jgi:hypothetical protein
VQDLVGAASGGASLSFQTADGAALENQPKGRMTL